MTMLTNSHNFDQPTNANNADNTDNAENNYTDDTVNAENAENANNADNAVIADNLDKDFTIRTFSTIMPFFQQSLSLDKTNKAFL